MNEKILKNDELAVYKLRALYAQYGYRPYKMSKFEEYDLYARNKDFLVSDRVITFTDTDGRLLALKPDVTLSIIKNTRGAERQKVYYNENVYRVSGASGQFKEIMQAGIECIGNIDALDVFEVVSLAAESLALIRPEFVLDISHMGILSAVLSEAESTSQLKRQITALIADKNLHELERLISDAAIPAAVADKLLVLANLYGTRASVLERLASICTTDEELVALDELRVLDELLTEAGAGDNIRYDFSVVNNMRYYNGIVFKGFLDGICEGVLVGGSYDKLLNSMRVDGRAIGFALYLDLLEELDTGGGIYDVDVLLVYGEETSPMRVAQRKRELIELGKTVYSSPSIPHGIRYRELVSVE